jgi:hypothetical protein
MASLILTGLRRGRFLACCCWMLPPFVLLRWSLFRHAPRGIMRLVMAKVKTSPVTTSVSKTPDLRGHASPFLAKSTDVDDWADATELIEWLNLEDANLRSYQKQTIHLIELLQQLNTASIEDALMRDRETPGRLPSLAQVDVGEEIERALKPLARQPWRVRVTSDGRWFLRQDVPDIRYHGLVWITQLSPRALTWIRQCKQCGRSFLARSSRNWFDSRECERSYEDAQRKTPEARAARATWMREHRRVLAARLQRKQKREARKT